MNCSDCISILVRKRVDGTVDRVCCLDGKALGAIVDCNQFFKKVDDTPLVEAVVPPEVVDLGYGAVPRKRGRPKKA